MTPNEFWFLAKCFFNHEDEKDRRLETEGFVILDIADTWIE